MTRDGARARALLAQGYTCAFVRGAEEKTSRERGRLPLLRLCEGSPWRGFSAADKIVGKAAALLYAYLGAKEVYAETLSRAGEDVLQAHGIACEYGVRTDTIVNHRGDGICPMEEAAQELSDPENAAKALRAKFYAEMRHA